MRNEILGNLGVWRHSSRDMLDVGTATRCIGSSPTIINMRMSPHGLTDHIAHHWGTFVSNAKLPVIELQNSASGAVNCPLRSGHRAVTGFMHWLCVT